MCVLKTQTFKHEKDKRKQMCNKIKLRLNVYRINIYMKIETIK